MKVLFDTDYLMYLLTDPSRYASLKDPNLPDDVANLQRKIECLLERLKEEKAKVIIPTPVLAELCAQFGDKLTEVLGILESQRRFDIADYDKLAAVETGLSMRAGGSRKKSLTRSQWHKVKFDRQIVAIAKVNGVDTVYSNDSQVCRWSREAGLKAVSVIELDNPPPAQVPMDYPPEGGADQSGEAGEEDKSST